MNLFGICPTVCPRRNSCSSLFFPECSKDINKHKNDYENVWQAVSCDSRQLERELRLNHIYIF